MRPVWFYPIIYLPFIYYRANIIKVWTLEFGKLLKLAQVCYFLTKYISNKHFLGRKIELFFIILIAEKNLFRGTNFKIFTYRDNVHMEMVHHYVKLPQFFGCQSVVGGKIWNFDQWQGCYNFFRSKAPLWTCLSVTFSHSQSPTAKWLYSFAFLCVTKNLKI